MDIIVKGINNKIVFMMSDKASFDTLFDQLNELLDKPLFKNSSYHPRAFFDFGCRNLEESEVQRLLVLLHTKEVVLFSGIKMDVIQKPKKIAIEKGTIRAGQQKVFYEDTILIGDINPGGVVETHATLYIMGKVRGRIDGMQECCQIHGSHFENAHIRLFHQSHHAFTSFDMTKLYYKERKIIIENGGENQWLEQL